MRGLSRRLGASILIGVLSQSPDRFFSNRVHRSTPKSPLLNSRTDDRRYFGAQSPLSFAIPIFPIYRNNKKEQSIGLWIKPEKPIQIIKEKYHRGTLTFIFHTPYYTNYFLYDKIMIKKNFLLNHVLKR